MKILICGLPGTGKTTLSNIIAKKYKYSIESDFSIFRELNINIINREDKKFISKNYSQLLYDYIKNANDNIVFDFEYSILPKELAKYQLCNLKIVYLGFDTLSNETMFNLFRKSCANREIEDTELKRRILSYKILSKIYKRQCEDYGFKFFDINKDREIIFDEILKFIETK